MPSDLPFTLPSLRAAYARGLSPVAVIEGADEKARGVVQVKDLILGAQIAENATLEEWKERPSQVEVARADLAVEVQKIIDTHKDANNAG